MGAHLDLDDVAATSELAKAQLAELRAENERLKSAIVKWSEVGNEYARQLTEAQTRLASVQSWKESVLVEVGQPREVLDTETGGRAVPRAYAEHLAAKLVEAQNTIERLSHYRAAESLCRHMWR